MKRMVAAAAVVLGLAGSHAQQPSRTHLVIVVDGLRPDDVTTTVMPRLHRLGQRGIVFTAHHSVFPTVTRLNASSFATGAYPETHGLLGNNIYVPKANPTKGLDTGDRRNLEAIERAEGTLLTAPTLGELLRSAGKTLLVVSSGSSGSAYLMNHTAATGGVIHYEFVRPPALAARVAATLGPAPAHATPNDPQNTYAIDAYLGLGLNEIHPDVTFMWLNDPDGTAHAKGIGAELTLKSLALVDAGIGRIEDTLQSRGLLDRTNIIVTSDHGFSTHTRALKLTELVEPFTKLMADGSKDIVVAEGAIYLRSGRDPARVAAIVAALQKRSEVGAIFTRPRLRSDGDGRASTRQGSHEADGGVEGSVPGTLSFDTARWNHARAGDILVSANWTSEKNSAGVAGTTADGGVAGHGSSSPYDIHNTLMAAGPDFREHAASDVPTANVDLAPTLLHLLGLKPAPSMTGRIIEEGLRDGTASSAIRVDRLQERVKTPDGTYELTAHMSMAAGHRYLDFTEVKRQ